MRSGYKRFYAGRRDSNGVNRLLTMAKRHLRSNSPAGRTDAGCHSYGFRL